MVRFQNPELTLWYNLKVNFIWHAGILVEVAFGNFPRLSSSDTDKAIYRPSSLSVSLWI